MTHSIAVIAGDGAGPEVVAEARKAVDALGLAVEWHELPWGTAHYHETGAMMPPDALDVVRRHDALLLGADLNTWSTPFLEGALDILYERFPDTPRFEGATFAAAGVIPRRLDHFLVRLPDGHTTHVRRIPKRYGSDHHPLVAVVRFPTSGVGQRFGQSDL